MADIALDMPVYRQAVALCASLYQIGGKAGEAGGRLRETALAVVLNLASGLGFWEKEWKVSHFAAARKALLQVEPLLEVMENLGVDVGHEEKHPRAQIATLLHGINHLLQREAPVQRMEAGV